MRYFAILLLLVGCAEPRDYQPLIAAAIGVSAVAGDVAPDPPQPEPIDPQEKCPNCDGTGQLGDGTVTISCPSCGGDGVLDPVDKSLANFKTEILAEIAKHAPPPQELPDIPQPPTADEVAAAVVAKLKAEFGPVSLAMAADQSPAFLSDYAQALAIAKRLDRPLLVVVSSKTCGPCRSLTKLQQGNLKWLAERYVLCRLYVQDSPEVVRALGVNTFPTQIIYSGGIEKIRRSGLPRRDYWDWLEVQGGL